MVEFDTKGLRSNVKIDILGLISDRFQVVSWYKITDGINSVPLMEVRLLLFLESIVNVDFFFETG